MGVHGMPGVAVSPAVCLTALVASSLGSRTAASLAAGAFRAHMVLRPVPWASAAVAGPMVSWTGHLCSSAARAGAVVFIGSSISRLDQPRLGVFRMALPPRSEHV